jgi:hypothetical protein
MDTQLSEITRKLSGKHSLEILLMVLKLLLMNLFHPHSKNGVSVLLSFCYYLMVMKDKDQITPLAELKDS